MTIFSIKKLTSSWGMGVIILLFSCSSPSTYPKRMHAHIVVNADTGKILKKNNACEQCHPASLTKKMTLYLLFNAIRRRKINFHTKFKISERAARQVPSKLGLVAGETISVKTIIEALVVKSANDIAVVAAEGIAGSVEAFVKMMNKQAFALRMRDTHFENASGLPNEKQVTTVKDMALLARALIRSFPEFSDIFALRSFEYKGHKHYTHNKLLNTFHGTNGIKTGYIDMSGYNISASIKRYDASHKPLHLICIVVGSDSAIERDQEVIDLVEPIFLKQKALFYQAGQPLKTGLSLANSRSLAQNTDNPIWMRAPICTKLGTKLLLEQYANPQGTRQTSELAR